MTPLGKICEVSKMDYNQNHIKSLLPKRPKDAHKGTFGSVLNIAGSEFYSGAAYFSSLAPLKVGCGKSTLISVQAVLTSVSALSPDIILYPINVHKIIFPKFYNYNAISIGCGLSTNDDAIKLFKLTIEKMEKSQIPLVIDADGLNILAGLDNPKLPVNTILTPHPLEMARLLGTNVENIIDQPEFWAVKCCEKYNCTTVLKLHKTVIVDVEGRFYTNNTGNTALSKGGSGDVLTGMITGLLAQGLSPFEASVLAVYLHGRAAEIASIELTEYSVLASDLLNYIHLAIRELT